MPLNNEKHKNFKRIAEGRVFDIKEKFRLLSNLASNNYEFTQADSDAIFKEIERHLNFTKEAFAKRLQRLNSLGEKT